uniref:Transmembrane protein n=1 Tax=Neospora caninum (strain Liverpool) TaxID=572307 RepID=A0A0F7UJ29_NEOCL|nr:TPA: hypothetical protein BN1204_057593 [Neospora caninum Liverpool]
MWCAGGRTQCHSTVDCARREVFCYTPNFFSNRRFRAIPLCAVVTCVLVVLSPEWLAFPRGSFPHPAPAGVATPGRPQFFFVSASRHSFQAKGNHTSSDGEVPPTGQGATATYTHTVTTGRRGAGGSLPPVSCIRSQASAHGVHISGQRKERRLFTRFLVALVPILATAYAANTFFMKDTGKEVTTDQAQKQPESEEVRFTSWSAKYVSLLPETSGWRRVGLCPCGVAAWSVPSRQKQRHIVRNNSGSPEHLPWSAMDFQSSQSFFSCYPHVQSFVEFLGA